MDWKTSCPKKPGFYWAISQTDAITIFKRSAKLNVWAFGGEAVEWKTVKSWGDAVKTPDLWANTEPTEEGWFSVKYADKSIGIVRVAMGSKIHCYDFDLPSEIDIKPIAAWFGPLDLPKK